jgi:hypothetical protein
MVFQALHDGALEFGDALEGAASDAVLRDLGKEALDHVERGSRGRMSAFRSCFGAAQSS